MKTYGQRIQEYRDFVQQTCIREEAESRAIKACQDILTEQACQMESKRTSYFDFLYEQSRFIKKDGGYCRQWHFYIYGCG